MLFTMNEDTKKKLRKAHLSSNKDKGQREAMADWENTLYDGLGLAKKREKPIFLAKT
jgi:hypothetical protein